MGLFGRQDDDKEREAVQRHREAQQRLGEARRQQQAREQESDTASPQRGRTFNTSPRSRGSLAGYPEGSWRKHFDLYVVKRGDTLWDIALESYGDGNAWDRIQRANPIVLKDPDLIHPGLVLRIPKGEGEQLA
jgi:nucleoid-associated protein YgaU